MKKGGGVGGEYIEGGLLKFLDTREGGSEKIVRLGGGLQKSVHIKTNRRGEGMGGSWKIKPLASGGC